MEHFIEQVSDEKCPCRTKNESRKRQPVPVLLSILIAVLPKCPFCVFGYSGVMVLCSGTRIYDRNPVPYYWYLPVIIAGAVALSLWWNYRGRRTWWALALAVAGGALVMQATRFGASEALYYAGAGMIFLGVFVNGSFMPFWRKSKQYLHL